MADIRKRNGKNGPTYQVRYPSKATKSGYAYATFRTMKEARAFLESGRARDAEGVTDTSITTVPAAIERWLQICEKEGTDGNEPVTAYTLKNYKYYAEFMLAYPWEKALQELASPDIVEFRSWLLTQCPSRYVARKTLTYFQTVLGEMALRGHGVQLPARRAAPLPSAHAAPGSLTGLSALVLAVPPLADAAANRSGGPMAGPA